MMPWIIFSDRFIKNLRHLKNLSVFFDVKDGSDYKKVRKRCSWTECFSVELKMIYCIAVKNLLSTFIFKSVELVDLSSTDDVKIYFNKWMTCYVQLWTRWNTLFGSSLCPCKEQTALGYFKWILILKSLLDGSIEWFSMFRTNCSHLL